MRVLFTTSPGIGHVFPTVPLAYAFRAAGHQVLLATTGHAAAAGANAGLAVYDVAPDVDMGGVFMNFRSRFGPDVPQVRPDNVDDALRFVAQLFGHVSDVMADGTVRLAQSWRPDLVVYSHLQ